VDDKHAEFITEFSDLNVGSILSLSANPDLPFVLAVGGDNNKSENFKVLDISMSKRGKDISLLVRNQLLSYINVII